MFNILTIYIDSDASVDLCFTGSMFHQKPLYVAIAQRKEERQAQLLLKFSQVMRGFAGQSAVIPGRYSSLYYPVPGVSTQVAARPRPGMMYQPFGMRPGWGADGYANYSIPAFNASPFRLVSLLYHSDLYGYFKDKLLCQNELTKNLT